MDIFRTDTTTMSYLPRPLRTLSATFALFAASSASAHTFCVSDATQLQAALTASSTGGPYAGETNYIDVVQGTYKTGTATNNLPFRYSSKSTFDLILTGGYDAGCNTTTLKASQTILDGNHATTVLEIHDKQAEVDVFAFTLHNGESTGSAGGVSFNSGTGDGGLAVFEGNIVRNNHASLFDAGVYVGSNDRLVIFEGNLVYGNTAEAGYGAGEIRGGNDGVAVYNNTITRNTSVAANVAGGLYVSAASGNTFVVNNIFWNNSTFGVFLASQNTYFRYNDTGTMGGVTPAESTGNLSVNPKFVDADGEDFHLAGGSTLFGMSRVGFTTRDPDGNESVGRGHTDIGAYNETIFEYGFDD